MVVPGGSSARLWYFGRFPGYDRDDTRGGQPFMYIFPVLLSRV